MSLLSLSDPLVSGSLNAHLGSLSVNRLFIGGREITLLGDPQSLQATIQEIQTRIADLQTKIADLDAFCTALSQGLIIGPLPGDTAPVTYPTTQPAPE